MVRQERKKVGDLLVEDFKIRKFIKDSLYEAGIPKIEIERNPNRVRIFIHCARPGIVIGRGGADIEKLRLTLEGMVGKRVAVNIVEIRNPTSTHSSSRRASLPSLRSASASAVR